MKKVNKSYKLLFTVLLCSLFSFAHTSNSTNEAAVWIEQTFQSLSEEERIAQLFLVATYSNKDETHYKAIETLIQRYNVGGLIFFQGNYEAQVTLTNRYQSMAKTPLLIAMDAEWGLGMRLSNAMSFPKQVTLGALREDALIYNMGVEIARQLRCIGVHINFAPVIDVNNNPNNPVIGNRSFGGCKEKVATKGIAYMKGLQDNGILAVAKHFPGHGDTDKDSHKELPIISHDRARVDELELYPFKKAIEEGSKGIMVAHLYVPAYDATPQQPTSLSEKVVTGLLKEELGFQGFVFTDALNMKGVCAQRQPGQADVQALIAGNDVLVFPEDLPQSIEHIKQAIREKTLDGKAVDEKVKRILRLKYQMNLQAWQPIATKELGRQLHTPQAQLLKQQLFEQAITVVANEEQLIPLKDLGGLRIASLSIMNETTAQGAKNLSQAAADPTQPHAGSAAALFPAMLKKYAPIAHHTLVREQITPEVLEQLANQLKHYQVVVVGIYDMSSQRSRNFGLQEAEVQFLKSLEELANLIIVPFGSVYSLECFSKHKHIIAAYEQDLVAAQVVPQIIFGALSAEGKLPVSIPGAWQAGWGIRTERLERLGYTYPEAVDMDSCVLQNIDKIVEEAIASQATPGCQVLVGRNGKIVFEKGYGYHTYAKKQPVTLETIYDLASITKVVGTLQALMYLVSEEKLHLKKKLSIYLPALKGTNKGALKIHHILAHQAGLSAYLLSELKKTLLDKDARLRKELFRPRPSPTYHHQLTADLYGASWLKDLVWDCCVNAELREKSWLSSYDSQYSCVGFYLLHHLAEKLLAQPLDNFLEENFYQPLGLATLTYRPLHKFAQSSIAPTEEDMLFRKSLVQGVVHDPMAALYGGVAGNAGLFSNANDLAVILQMNLQDGYYGDKRYFKEGIIQQFTKKQFKNNHRGLGWDKKGCNTKVHASVHASTDTYGHNGFTGTATWVDPRYNLIYIFLSNRTYPDANNNRLNQQQVRARIHDIVYGAIKDRG